MFSPNLAHFRVPEHPIDLILDTDAYNEIDDQFAIAYLLHCNEKITLRAITAAPFFNGNSTSPADGMEKSYREILHLLTLANREDLTPHVFRGATGYLSDEVTPVVSEAAEQIVALSKDYSPARPLYLCAIGAITNVASAILLDPTLVTRTVLVWLGGHAIHVDHPTNEFNMIQDIAAARVVFDSGIALIQLPCFGVVDHFYTTKPELTCFLKDKGSFLADYLADHAIEAADAYAMGKPWSRVIWDVTAAAWLMNDGDRFLSGKIIPRPIITYDGTYAFSHHRAPMLYIDQVHRDALMQELFDRILRS